MNTQAPPADLSCRPSAFDCSARGHRRTPGKQSSTRSSPRRAGEVGESKSALLADAACLATCSCADGPHMEGSVVNIGRAPRNGFIGST